ncbi:kinetochore protein Spc25 [Brachionichthys hirsutus]|uniref:kinetochore protein Spc25 n=1 Tax=Brachionichthys hirsutus TaxID=412623 RepID=UPI0036046B03
MASITDPNTSGMFTNAMEDMRNKLLKGLGEISEATSELCQTHRHFLKSAHDTCLKKCKDDEMLFETLRTFEKDLQQKTTSLKEKRSATSEVKAEIQQKETQKEDIIQKIEKLKEEQAKRQELIHSQNRANKDRLRNLQKARVVFEDHLGMEIRKILSKTQLVKGERLQFVFRNIDPSRPDSAYVVTMGIKGDGVYQIVSSDPALERLPALESRLQGTNNLAAFLANVRKEFIAQARR